MPFLDMVELDAVRVAIYCDYDLFCLPSPMIHFHSTQLQYVHVLPMFGVLRCSLPKPAFRAMRTNNVLQVLVISPRLCELADAGLLSVLLGFGKGGWLCARGLPHVLGWAVWVAVRGDGLPRSVEVFPRHIRGSSRL
jgi:hypothetical protein